MATPSRSLNRQVVLDEDEYMESLSKIIARDFFPSLVHLDATNDYLDALRSQDPSLINASVRRLEEVAATPLRPFQTPGHTPYGGGPSETPLRTPRGEAPAKRARYDTDLSLDTFQARYTSEDNSSFTEILDEENRKRKEKWGWAWEAQRRVEAQRERLLADRERLMIEPQSVVGVREKFRIEAPTPAGLIEDVKGKGKGEETQGDDGEEEKEGEENAGLALAVVPTDVMAPQKDTRSAGVDGWKFKARNSLMFPPDADESPYHTRPTEASGDPRAIVHGSTRLPEQDDSRSRAVSAPPSPTRSRINAAITGTPYRPRSPTINSFSLVPNLPSPTPSELGPAAVKQLMTWGTLNATPRIISQSEDLPPPSTPFHLPAPSSREVISHKLSNNASKSLRVKAGLLGLGGRTPGISRTPVSGSASKKGSMAPPSWTPRRSEAAGSLTPAARRLLDRSTMGTAAARRAEAMDKIARWDGSKAKEQDLNRVRWTPTPGPVSKRGV
ncbi:nuclear protein DGCR14 [Mycena belliarum]|uniref:Nuclear protein DGCR14 n=1 Tax=Mycena belliarum TaxID=1033014 RepID=A0AAD6UJK2_9AGAR|nr:nuclear protein DGCR14 [Mycena belliae]